MKQKDGNGRNFRMICCEELDKNQNQVCEQHKGNCPNNPFYWNAKVREFGVKLGDYWEYESGWTYIKVDYCPFCGYKFPESLRDKYFEELEALGIDYWMEPEKVPEEYKSDKWWNK